VLGGTFNPPHAGHLSLALAAAEELGLTRVLLTPALVAPHKLSAPDPGAEHRLRMCLLLADEDPRLGVCPLELERPGPSYTVDTLRSIQASEPSAELTLIVGADMARTLPTWREPPEILRLARLAVAAREGTEREAVADALAGLDGAASVKFLEMAPIEVSSSQVRDRIAAGGRVDGLLPSGVARYVAGHGLYRQPIAAEERPLP
jgi:nicotinate-nucleotide adenylyltransferase